MWKTCLINPTPFYGKILNKLGVEGNFLDLTKVIYVKPTDNIITDTKNWYQDQASFINATAPWFVRGGRQDQSHSAGIFSYHINYGNGTIYYGSRSVLVK